MPLVFDMPYDALQHYGGSNPCPPDFDLFWEQSLQELMGIEPEPELRPSSFEVAFADCYDMFYTGVGGARIHAKLVQPKDASANGPAVLMFHGYSGNAGAWLDKLGYAAQGFTVAAMDCRGQGGLSQDSGGVQGTTLRGHIIRGLDGPPEQLLFRSIYLDAVQLARTVMAMAQVDEHRVAATGKSQGGALTLVCAALEPRIRRAAPLFPFLCDFKRVWELDLADNAYWELADYFRKFDPRHERETEVFTRLGYIDVQFFCPRINAEVMMATGLMDKICPPSTQIAAYNKIVARKSLVTYPDFGHEELPGHSDLVFQFLKDL